METIYETPIEYYALLFYRRDYCELKEEIYELAKYETIDANKRIELMFEFASAAADIKGLTANQREEFKSVVRNDFYSECSIRIELVAKFLTSQSHALRLQTLLNDADFEEEQYKIVGIAAKVRNKPCDNLTWHGIEPDSEVVMRLKHEFEKQHKQVVNTPPIEEETEVEETVALPAWFPTKENIARWNERSLKEYNGTGWAALEKERLELIGKPFSQSDVNRGAKNMENRIKGCRKQLQTTS